ncbi:MAG TPA: adenylate/guanylate cyclase domain-containing protein [Noviherbaspirillum sp.]|nr:adenylate/guanylate cyclase domain-containing protein [Noviherbaspirillum sp.]
MIFPSIAVVRSLIAAVAVLLTIWAESPSSPLQSLFANEWLRDHFVRLQSSLEPETRITVIDIDESSLSAVGPWPWSRTRIAELLENLLGPYEARGVALDLVLPERADAEGDARLAMLAGHGPVVLAQAFDYVTRPFPVRVGQPSGGTPAPPHALGVSASGYIGNHIGLAEAPHTGNIGFIPDEDGTIRRLPVNTLFDERLYPTLSLALMQCCWGKSAVPVTNAPESTAVRRVPFSRDWNAYTIIPASQVFDQSAPKTAIANRLVIVGSSSLGLSDRVTTPLSASTSGVLVHAAMLSSLLDDKAGKSPSPWPGDWTAILFSALVAFTAAYTFPRLSALANVSLLAGASVIWLGIAYWIVPRDPDFSTTGPLVSNLFLLTVAVPFDWQLAQRKSRDLLGTLRQYVAKAVVDELLRRGLKDPLTPQRLHVTTLIADMEGYTSQVESLSIEEAAQLTRDFLACLAKPVLEKQGTLDKFTGDGLVAFWGAPLPIEDHADLALDAAQQITQEVARLSRERAAEGKRPLRVRIGVESGLAMAGDFGTSSRSIYTAVGDSVNTASRLEQVARDYPHDIIVGPGTVSKSIRHRFLFLDEKLVRGKGRPTKLYTLEPSA